MRSILLMSLTLLAASPVFAGEQNCKCSHHCMTKCQKSENHKCKCKTCACSKDHKCGNGEGQCKAPGSDKV